MTFTPSITAEVSVNNSTTTPLGGEAVFTGTADDATQSSTITVFVQTDAKSATNGLEYQFSPDGTTWSTVKTHTVQANQVFFKEVTLVANFFRIVYTNGFSAQSTFKLQTILHPTRNALTEFPLSSTADVAFGKINGAEILFLAGENTTVGTSFETLWPEGGTYVFPPAPGVMTVSSDSASDTSGGTGGRTVAITFLDAAFNESTETITMSGTSGVTTVAAMSRINGMAVFSSGSSGTNVGNIYIGTGTITSGKPATVYGVITPDAGVARDGVYTVPGDKNTKLTMMSGAVNSVGELVEMVVYMRFFFTGTWWRLIFFTIADGSRSMDLTASQSFSPGTDVMIMARTLSPATSTNVNVTISLLTVSEK